MILRVVLGRLPSGTDAAALVEVRGRLSRTAHDVHGLDSLIVGARRRAGAPPDEDDVEAAIMTVWRDADSMIRATGIDEQDRFLATRLNLPFSIDGAVHYEIVGRTFAALPPHETVYLRIMTLRARPNEESRLMEVLRQRQERLVELGLVAQHLGRRIDGRDCEAITVGVWPDRATIRKATGGGPEQPLFAEELADWADGMRLETYDGIEIAPRLPAASGPPLFVIDDDMRIVDITATAAATLGWTAVDLVGRAMPELSRTDPDTFRRRWTALLADGEVSGEGKWLVPDAGLVFIRFVARRDVPIAGRHSVLVHRWNEPAPTPADLDAALISAFPGRTP
jgi:PAS domain-containing protein